MPFFAIHSQNIAANGTIEPLTGWQYERLPWPALVEIALIADAIGLVATITSGSDTLGEESPVSAGGTDGVLPDQDKPQFEDTAAPGDKLKIRIRETAGVATTDLMGWVRVTRLS